MKPLSSVLSKILILYFIYTIPVKNEVVSKIRQALSGAREVSILTHTNPDGDAIGSALALYHFLRAKGINAHVLLPSMYPDFLAWMPEVANSVIFEDDEELCGRYLSESDMVFCVDFNSPDRLDGMEKMLELSKATTVLIDHHVDRGHFCDLAYKSIHVSSTAELIYRFIEELGEQAQVDATMATCLYVGIMTDTGSFSYACNSSDTFRVVSALMALGVDAEHIHRMVYDTYSEERLRLLGFCLSDKLMVMPEFGTAYIALSQKELERFHYKNGDTEGVVNYTLGIKGIVFGALITERKDRIKISLRSKGNFDVNRIAVEHFNGGGHKNASGGDLYCSFDEAVKLFRSIIPMYGVELKKAKE